MTSKRKRHKTKPGSTNRVGLSQSPSRPEEYLEDKIVTALERLSLASKILLWDAAKKEGLAEKGLSPIQIKFLLFLPNHLEGQCRVSQLAKEFGLTQATVSDAVKSLVSKGLVSKKPSREDGRVQTLQLTPAGKRLANRMANWPDAIRLQLKEFSDETKTTVMVFLMELIRSLQRSGIIEVARMCISCGNFREDAHPDSERPHHCSLTDTPLAITDLNVDCPMHTV